MTSRHSSEQPSRNEDEYFARQEAELIESMRTRLDQERQEQERKSHYMKCPKCGADLREEEHHDVKIDVCPECKGVWLDAGEMDLIRQQQKAGRQNVLQGLFDFFPSRGSARK